MLKRMLWLVLMAGCGGALFTAQAQNFIYIWTDSQGQVQYSELAPPAGVKYEMVRRPTDTEQNPAAGADLGKEQADSAKQAAEQAQKEKEETEQAQKEANDVFAKNCEISKKNIAALQGDSPVIKTDDKGNKIALNAEQRKAELEKAQKDQTEYCKP